MFLVFTDYNDTNVFIYTAYFKSQDFTVLNKQQSRI